MFFRLLCLVQPTLVRMVGTEHRNYADFALRSFGCLGLSWKQLNSNVFGIQLIPESNISVTIVNLFASTLTLTGLKNSQGLWLADSSR